MKEKKEKAVVILDERTPGKRAKGIKMPSPNPTLIAKKSLDDKLPTVYVPLFKKIEARGKDGIRLATLCDLKTSAGRFQRWRVRSMMGLGYVGAIGEPKTLSIAKSVQKKSTKSAKKNHNQAKAA